MVWGDWIAEWGRRDEPEHLRRGRLGEHAARRQLSKAGLKFLYANFSSENGEIDLVFREAKTLVFVEVKTRSSESWSRPAAAVNGEKQRKLIATARNYLRLLHDPEIAYRFDIVEVLLNDDEVAEIRHQPNAFAPGRR